MAVAAFAYVSFQVLAANEGALSETSAAADRARLIAAADAAVLIAIHGLSEDDPSARWGARGEPRHLDFNGVDLTVSVEDEHWRASTTIRRGPCSRAPALREGSWTRSSQSSPTGAINGAPAKRQARPRPRKSIASAPLASS